MTENPRKTFPKQPSYSTRLTQRIEGPRWKVFENKSKPNEMHDEGLGGKKTNSARLFQLCISLRCHPNVHFSCLNPPSHSAVYYLCVNSLLICPLPFPYPSSRHSSLLTSFSASGLPPVHRIIHPLLNFLLLAFYSILCLSFLFLTLSPLIYSQGNINHCVSGYLSVSV